MTISREKGNRKKANIHRHPVFSLFFRHRSGYYYVMYGMCDDVLCVNFRYAWAIPDKRALNIIKHFSPVVEIACGAGWQLFFFLFFFGDKYHYALLSG